MDNDCEYENGKPIRKKKEIKKIEIKQLHQLTLTTQQQNLLNDLLEKDYEKLEKKKNNLIEKIINNNI